LDSWYVPDGEVQNPLVSPLYADLAGLPPLLVHVGDYESFLDDATRVTQRDEDGGVQGQLKVWPEAFHAFHLFAGMIPEADQALAEAASGIAERLAGSASGPAKPTLRTQNALRSPVTTGRMVGVMYLLTGLHRIAAPAA
jgi:hypothetical protein